MTSRPPAFTATGLKRAARELAAADPDLGRVVARLGPPPMWDREPGFPTLVHLILEQQVSLASARAAFDKLNARLSSLNPTSFLTIDDSTLKEIGFSAQKGRYCRGLARAVECGGLRPEELASLPD